MRISKTWVMVQPLWVQFLCPEDSHRLSASPSPQTKMHMSLSSSNIALLLHSKNVSFIKVWVMLDKDMRGMYIWPPSPSSVSTWVCGRGVKQDYVNPPCMDTESIMPVDHVLVLILFFVLSEKSQSYCNVVETVITIWILFLFCWCIWILLFDGIWAKKKNHRLSYF